MTMTTFQQRSGCSRRAAALALLLSAGWGLALAQSPYPNRPITMVLGFGAGGSTDAVSRLLAQQLTESLKVPVIVENKPGGQQIIAIQTLKSKPADGYTLYMGTGSSLAQNPGVRSDLGYDPLADFVPVALVGMQPGVITVKSDLPVANLAGLIELAKKEPGKLNYGSQGVGSASHLAMEYLLAKTGTSLTHIPLKSDADIGVELLAGRIDAAFMTTTIAVPLAKAGKQKILAATSVSRLSFLPDLPSLGEAGIDGLAGLDPFTFYGIVALKDTPAEIVATLNRAVNAALAAPEVGKKIRETFLIEPKSDSPEGFQRFLQAELKKWNEVGERVKLNTKN